MQKILAVYSRIGDSVLEDKEEGDLATTVETNRMAFRMAKESVSSLNATTIDTAQGSVTLPPNFVTQDTCIESTVGCFLYSFMPSIL